MQPIVEPLDSAIRATVDEHFKRAFSKLKQGDKAGAADEALEGWRRMPAPTFGWDHSLSNAGVLVLILRQAGVYQAAIDVLNEQLKSEFYRDYQYHPHFLLGTVYFEMGDLNTAREHFKIADRISRGRCFVDENPAYKKLLKG